MVNEFSNEVLIGLWQNAKPTIYGNTYTDNTARKIKLVTCET